MDFLGQFVFWSGVLLCFSCAFVLLEVGMGLCVRPRMDGAHVAGKPKTVLLIPAHNEERGMDTMLQQLQANVGDDVHVLVIADNCSDETAKIAREAGVDVWERNEPTQRGKPCALAWALSRLAASPPDAVVFLDADTWFGSGKALDLARRAVAAQRPVQALNLMHGGGLRGFAFCFRNEARLRGLAAMKAPCQLNGTGFALPWALIEAYPVPVGELAEDASWGWTFTRAGLGPILESEVTVLSDPPGSKEGVQTQLRRWEHGILAATLHQLPKLLRSAFLPPKIGRILHLCDVLVPPLALLVLSCLSLLLVGVLGSSLHAIIPLAFALLLLGSAVVLGWWTYGRENLAFTQLLKAPFYAVGKIGIYLSFLFRRQKGWQRTERDDS